MSMYSVVGFSNFVELYNHCNIIWEHLCPSETWAPISHLRQTWTTASKDLSFLDSL